MTRSPPLKPGPSSFAASSCWRENSPFSQGFGKKKYRDFSQIYFFPTGQNCSNYFNYFVAFERFSTFARWCTCSRLNFRSSSAARCGHHLITWFTRLTGKPRIMYVAWAPLEKWTRFLQYSCPWMTSQFLFISHTTLVRRPIGPQFLSPGLKACSLEISANW